MDRYQLKTLLQCEGIRASSYSLNGVPQQREPHHATYVIDLFGFGWKVFRDEDGHESCVHICRTEDEACSHLLDLVLRDSSTR